jgi:hypothetical protein
LIAVGENIKDFRHSGEEPESSQIKQLDTGQLDTGSSPA